MAYNPNNEFVLHTSKGDFLLLTLRTDINLSTYTGQFVSTSQLYYNNSLITNETRFRMSFVQRGLYRYEYSPIMGNINIIGLSNGIIENNSNGSLYLTIPPLARSGAKNDLGTSNNIIDVKTIIMIMDDYDNVMIRQLRFRSNTETAAYSDNTSDKFGFIDGYEINVNNFSFNYNIALVIQNFSTTDAGKAVSVFAEHTDPYNPGGNSGTGGGTGTFDGTGDNVDIPSLPTLSATDTGFITLFNPSMEQLKNLANYMWSSGFDIATFKKLFADPMDCILGLSIVPVAVPNGEASTVSVGNISTGISMTKAASQYVEVDCGTLDVKEYWGSYLDYDPFTKAEIYLPYIGTHPIAVDDIMNKLVHVVYHVDILSGACTAYVKCGDSVLYTFIGQCSSSIPVTGNDWTNVINGVLSIAGAVGSMVATGGASAPMALETIASTAVNSMKPSVEKSGSMSGTGGMLAVQTPYLILTRPRQALPASQNKFTGYPSFITEKLDSLSGYTEIESVHLENIAATESELSEIENLLKMGVLF